MTPVLGTLFLVLVLITAVAALRTADLLASVVVFGAFSFFSAMFFASLGALDVAFTEAAVGAAITTVLFAAVIRRTGRRSTPAARPAGRATAPAVALAFVCAGAALLWSAVRLPPVGEATSPAARHVSPRFIEQGPGETGSPNMVTGVLADYRGYDTLGETVVIFAGGLACLLILGRSGAREEPS